MVEPGGTIFKRVQRSRLGLDKHMPDIRIKTRGLCRQWAFIYDVLSFEFLNKTWRGHGRKADDFASPDHASRRRRDTAAVETGAEMRTNEAVRPTQTGTHSNVQALTNGLDILGGVPQPDRLK